MESLVHPLPIFSAERSSHYLTNEALLFQLRKALLEDPRSTRALSFRNRALAILEATSPKPFPENTEIQKLPQNVQNSWSCVQKMTPEKQLRITYYERGGEWFINLNDTKISLQNGAAPANPSGGVYVSMDNTYFLQPAAIAYANSIGRALPENAVWEKIADFLGGYGQLRDILQIPCVGVFHSSDGLGYLGSQAGVWSADDCSFLHVSNHGSCITSDDVSVTSVARSVRTLDS